MFSISQLVAPIVFLRLAAAVTITVSDAQNGNAGTNAIDMNNNTIWHSQFNPAKALPHTATLDLGSSTLINTFTYLPRQDVKPGNQIYGNIGQHDVQLSDDNRNWRTVISRTVFPDTSSLKKETFPNSQARYVRIIAYTESGNRGPWTSAAEFSVFLAGSAANSGASPTPATSGGPLNTISASIAGITVNSFQGGNEGTKAIDGDRNTIWHSRYNPAVALPHNAVIDLGATPLSVVGITYLPRQDVPVGGQIYGNIGQHTIEVSSDKSNWIQVAKSTFVDDNTLKTEKFSAVQARYVRVTALTEAGNRGPWTSAAEFGVLVTSNTAAPVVPSKGKWGNVIALPLVAAAAFMVPGSGIVTTFSASGLTDFNAKGSTSTATYNPSTGAVSLRVVSETKHDMFCPGLSLDFEGRAIVTGGNNHKRTSIYSPSASTWTSAPDMNLDRGYQSSTTLSDGRIFVIGGSWLEPELRGNRNGEIYDGAKNTWTNLPGCPVAPMLTNDAGGVFRSDNHAWLFGWKDGSVFQAGPSKAMNWYGTTGTGSRSAAGVRAADGDSMCGVSVMYDAVNGKIFTAGGSPSYENSQATSNVHLITIGAVGSNPSVTKLTSMANSRAFHNAVVLPDGKIFVTGGQSYAVPWTDTTAIMQPELWDPETQNFTVLPSHRIPRTYHSIALLLLDGTVFTAGGGLCGGCSVNHLDAEIYSPGYLFNADGTAATRPNIASMSSTTVRVGGSITLTTDSPVANFSLIRYGSVTHTVNTDQRRVPITSQLGTSHTITLPSDAGVVLPGYWMLFAVDAKGVPSVAKTVKVTL